MAVVKLFLRPIGEYGLAIAPGNERYLKPIQKVQNETLRRMLGVPAKTSVDGMHLLTDIPMIRERHDALKSGFLANVQRQPVDSRILKAFKQSQECLIKDSCFTDIAGLQIYRNYANWCRYIPQPQWRQVMALWKIKHHQSWRLRLRDRFSRKDALDVNVTLFTDLSRCGVNTAKRIHRWILGQIPSYPSGCRGCGAERISTDHLLQCTGWNPDLCKS